MRVQWFAIARELKPEGKGWRRVGRGGGGGTFSRTTVLLGLKLGNLFSVFALLWTVFLSGSHRLISHAEWNIYTNLYSKQC